MCQKVFFFFRLPGGWADIQIDPLYQKLIQRPWCHACGYFIGIAIGDILYKKGRDIHINKVNNNGV